MIFTRPTPRRVWLPLEQIRWPDQLQLRDLRDAAGNRVLFLAERVQLMVAPYLPDGELYGQVPEWEPIPIVEEVRKGKGENILWAYGGNHRGEGYRILGVNSILCLVTPGTFEDARLYALSENSRHGWARTPAECRAVFDSLVNDAPLLRRTIEAGRGKGGTGLAIAAACGLSQTAVDRYIADAGKRVDRVTGRLIEAGEESPEVAERREKVAELAAQGKTQREIAGELGVGVGTVSRAFHPNPRVGVEQDADENDEPTDTEDATATDTPAALEFPPAEPTPTPATPPTPTDDAERAGDALKSIQGHLRAIARDLADLMETKYADHARAALFGRQLGLSADGTSPAVAELQGGFADCAVFILDHPDHMPPTDATTQSPAAELCTKTIGLSRAFTKRLKVGDDFAAKLRSYLGECGLLDINGEKFINGEEFVDERVTFLPLKGVHAVLEAAALPGPAKPAKEIKQIYDAASGGWIPPAVLRRRREKSAR